MAKWKVATTGRSASARAINDKLGEAVWCTCSRSKSWSLSQRRVRLSATGPNANGAIDPL